MRKAVFIILSVVLCIAAVLAFLVHKRRDVHHYPERRAWMESAITLIEADLGDESIYRMRDGGLDRPYGEMLCTGGRWLTARAIVFYDGTWMVYRQQCQKADPRIHDIFIGRGSDGKWYYSDAHFCINAMVLDMRGQPDSIADFRKSFSLVEFDGKSDVALEPTFNVR